MFFSAVTLPTESVYIYFNYKGECMLHNNIVLINIQYNTTENK